MSSLQDQAQRLVPYLRSWLLAWDAGNIGVWTPAFTGTSTAGVFTYNVQQGDYTRLGNRVFFSGRCRITAITTPPVGNMTITGLPIACAATYYGTVELLFISNFNYAANAMQLTAAVAPGTTTINLYESFDNAGAALVPAANFTNAACELIIGGNYKVG